MEVLVMSLNVYRSIAEIPKGMSVINTNDSFFDVFTQLSNEPFVEEVLFSIDKAICSSPLTFEGRTKSMGNLNKSFLSTGTKTLLNILSNPDTCFDVSECGNNALRFLPRISSGNVLWKNPVVVCDDNIPCEIYSDGKLFTDLFSFLNYCYES